MKNGTLFKNKYRIESARWKHWDYRTNGSYFITICTKNREHFFGEIEKGMMKLNPNGKMSRKYWLEIPNHFEHAILDEFVIMPDHMHGIITICRAPRRDAINRVSTGGDAGCRSGGITQQNNPMLHSLSIPKIIRWFKGRTT